MARLSFISDELLYKYTEEVVLRAEAAEKEAEAKLYSNVIDPFSAVFDAQRHGLTLDEWLLQEKLRQIQKTLQNALGDFHQNILGAVEGWTNLGRGGSIDVKNDADKVIAEIKNKHNTMNSSSAEAVYNKLANELRYGYKGYTAYLVSIVPKSPAPTDKPWSPNIKMMALREDIRKIDGKSFYVLVTARSRALDDLYQALPHVIHDIQGQKSSTVAASELFANLFYRAYAR